MTIRIPRKGDKTRWIHVFDVDGDTSRYETAETPRESQPHAEETGFQNSQDYWRVSGVNYRNKIYTVDLSKQLLPEGTQDEHASHRIRAESQGEFYVGDMPLYHSLFVSLFRQKDSNKAQEIEQARDFIQKNMRARWLMTLTRVQYNPKNQKDRVIHNYDLADSYFIDEDIVGKDRAIEQGDSSSLTALVGTGNIQDINAVYNWINQTPTWIWRVNNKPKQTDERVAGFGAYSDGADLGCNWGPGGRDVALGVKIVREAPAP